MPLPSLEVLVEAADAGLHPWVRDHIAAAARRAALAEELSFWLNTAAQDMAHATSFAAAMPQSGEPPESYLDRWLPLSTGGHVLAGPRYLGRDPDLPFVAVVGADRPLTAADRDALATLGAGNFAAFRPGFVMVTTADPAGTWPGTHPEMRQVVARLADLRRPPAHPDAPGRSPVGVPAGLALTPCGDVDCYDRYADIHRRHVERDPVHARHARQETRADLRALADGGTLFDVRVDGAWAGLVAAEPDARRGVRGFTVVELILDDPHRGHGYGRHLSTLLAQALPPDDEGRCLLGTIHHDNTAAYRAALNSGRVDVGGEIVIPL